MPSLNPFFALKTADGKRTETCRTACKNSLSPACRTVYLTAGGWDVTEANHSFQPFSPTSQLTPSPRPPSLPPTLPPSCTHHFTDLNCIILTQPSSARESKTEILTGHKIDYLFFIKVFKVFTSILFNLLDCCRSELNYLPEPDPTRAW